MVAHATINYDSLRQNMTILDQLHDTQNVPKGLGLSDVVGRELMKRLLIAPPSEITPEKFAAYLRLIKTHLTPPIARGQLRPFLTDTYFAQMRDEEKLDCFIILSKLPRTNLVRGNCSYRVGDDGMSFDVSPLRGPRGHCRLDRLYALHKDNDVEYITCETSLRYDTFPRIDVERAAAQALFGGTAQVTYLLATNQKRLVGALQTQGDQLREVLNREANYVLLLPTIPQNLTYETFRLI